MESRLSTGLPCLVSFVQESRPLQTANMQSCSWRSFPRKALARELLPAPVVTIRTIGGVGKSGRIGCSPITGLSSNKRRPRSGMLPSRMFQCNLTCFSSSTDKLVINTIISPLFLWYQNISNLTDDMVYYSSPDQFFVNITC